MTLLKTPICEFGKKAENFKLKSTDNKVIDLNDVKGKNGTLIMFICNHCPYVVATIEDIVKTTNELKNNDINSIAIMSNDPTEHPEDSFENMLEFAKKYDFNFPYVIDEDQSVAKNMMLFAHLTFLDLTQIWNFNTEEEFMKLTIE